MPQMETVIDAHGEHDQVSHVASLRSLFGTCAALLVLTGVTVGVSYIDFGTANLYVALGVAVVKALLVALFFMHLRYDRPLNSLVFGFSLIFLAIFIGGSLRDTVNNQPHVIQGESPAMVTAQKEHAEHYKADASNPESTVHAEQNTQMQAAPKP